MDRPNILLIMTDQQRADSLGCYGADWLETPNLDALAAEGVRFDACTVNNPICTPSRASIMTGKELPGHGLYRLHDVLSEEETLFPERLREADYRTALFGKLHVSGRAWEERVRHPNDGFEVYEWSIESCVSLDSRFSGYAPWLRSRDPAFLADLKARGRKVLHHPEEVHFTRWAAERTVDYIRAHAKDGTPFFAYMSIFDPHNPYDSWPKTMDGKVDRAKLPKPIERQDALTKAARRELEGSYLGSDIPDEAIEEMRHGYAASVAFADQEIGKVLAALEQTGLAENTLVIFTSDHGDALGDHGMMVKGAALYEPVIRVPMILRWPGHIAPGTVSDALVQPHDLAVTITRAAGVEPASDGPFATGIDLVAAANGAADRDFAVCAYRNSGINSKNEYWDPPLRSTSVRSKTGKLVAYESGGETELEWFNLVADPEETRNAIGDASQSAEVARHMSYLLTWLHGEGGFAGSRGGSAVPSKDSQFENALRRS